MSISPTFFEHLFCTEVKRAALLCWKLTKFNFLGAKKSAQKLPIKRWWNLPLATLISKVNVTEKRHLAKCVTSLATRIDSFIKFLQCLNLIKTEKPELLVWTTKTNKRLNYFFFPWLKKNLAQWFSTMVSRHIFVSRVSSDVSQNNAKR